MHGPGWLADASSPQSADQGVIRVSLGWFIDCCAGSEARSRFPAKCCMGVERSWLRNAVLAKRLFCLLFFLLCTFFFDCIQSHSNDALAHMAAAVSTLSQLGIMGHSITQGGWWQQMDLVAWRGGWHWQTRGDSITQGAGWQQMNLDAWCRGWHWLTRGTTQRTGQHTPPIPVCSLHTQRGLDTKL